MARRWWELSKDPDDYMGKSRRERRREEREDAAEEQGPEPQLQPRGHWGLIAATVAVWIGAMTLLHVHWWDFERHGPWLTPVTPFLLAGALEGLLLRRRPEWNRHHDPEGDAAATRRGAAAIGERARPYWAREGRAGEGLEAAPPADALNAPATEPAAAPDEVSARTRRSP